MSAHVALALANALRIFVEALLACRADVPVYIPDLTPADVERLSRNRGPLTVYWVREPPA